MQIKLLNHFESIYSKTKVQPIFTKKGQLQQSWNHIPNERRVGILHAFILLRPMLSRAFKTQKALRALSEMKQVNKIKVENLPIITSKLCSQMLALEHQALQTSDKCSAILTKAQDALQVF